MLALLVVLTFAHPSPQPQRQAECKAAYGEIACGYHCTAAYGEVRCAQTAQGACRAAYGKVVCWDPPRKIKGPQKARCETAYGQIACGFECLAAYGKIRCAATPDGACRAQYGDVVCSE
jgi:hypothetical protein